MFRQALSRRRNPLSSVVFRNYAKSIAPNQFTFEEIQQIPKADLHRHLDGSLRVRTIVELADKYGITFPAKTEEEMRKLIVIPDECQSLVEYLKAFEYTVAVSQTAYALSRIMYEVCEDAYLDGIRYLEIRFAPQLHTQQDLYPDKVLEAVIAGAKMAQDAFKDFHVRIIVCGIRSTDRAIVDDMARVAIKYKNEGVVAFDLAGPEYGYEPDVYKDTFAMIHKELMCSTLHAGEAADHTYVHKALFDCNVHRIGHGVNMRDNAELVQYVIDRGVPIEICVTSNWQTKTVKDYLDHPLPVYFQSGLVVVPCTDNTLMSDITLSQEYHKIQKLYNFDAASIMKMIDNSFRSAFIDDDLKTSLREKAQTAAFNIIKQKN